MNGDFSTATLLNVQTFMSQMITDQNNWIRRYLNPKHKTLLALIQNQQTFVRPLEDPDKDMKVDVHWFDKSGVSAGEITETCDFTGTKGGTYKQEYELTDGLEAAYSYDNKVLRTSQYETMDQYRAAMNIQHIFAIIEDWNDVAVAFLNANLSAGNKWLDGKTFNGNDETEVPAVEYNPTIFSYLSLVKEMNDMNQAFIIGGSGMQEMAYLANAQNDPTGRNLLAEMNMYTDAKTLATDSDDPFYVIDPSAYALATKTRYTSTPVPEGNDRIKYSINDPFGIGVSFDVIERIACLDDEHTTTHVKIKARFDFFANPKTLLDPDNQGILKFVKV